MSGAMRVAMTIAAASLTLAGRASARPRPFTVVETTIADMRDRPAETLIAASHGNPLFLTQLVVDAREGDQPATAPASLNAVVERRVERLSEHARAAAEIAACIGDRF